MDMWSEPFFSAVQVTLANSSCTVPKQARKVISTMADQEQSYLGHRDACDECHQRKVRCIAESGACRNCISLGKTCIYSTKVPVGRPRKRKTALSPSDLKADDKPAPQPAMVPPQSFSGFDGTNSGVDSSACPKPPMHSNSPPSFSCFDGTLWNMEPDLVNSSSSSVSSLANPFSMQNQPSQMGDL
jgi:Fungal Zn(2)-Cys(6) binuclear cluster domain